MGPQSLAARLGLQALPGEEARYFSYERDLGSPKPNPFGFLVSIRFRHFGPFPHIISNKNCDGNIDERRLRMMIREAMSTITPNMARICETRTVGTTEEKAKLIRQNESIHSYRMALSQERTAGPLPC